MEPLPKRAPLWSIFLITELADSRAAVVVVLHHVLADGLGGVNVLAALVDPGLEPASVPFPRPRPALPVLARDALLTRLREMRQAAGSWRALRRAMFAMNRQRRFHTLVTHVRGPAEPLTLDGHPVSEAIPVAIGERGKSVSFEALSYAGILAITVLVDPEHGPDLDAAELRWRELAAKS
jgi:hypothetical protein